MLFLYRPRQTWMPYQLPRGRTDQGAYNRSVQDRFQATKQVPAPTPTDASTAADRVEKLAELHAAGVLTDEEFAAAKARALST